MPSKSLKYSVPYTPYDSGKLRGAATIENSDGNSGKIQYPGLKYADYQYYSDDSSWDRHTAGTTSYWIDYVATKEVDIFRLLGFVISTAITS
jgi:hypothetical protein